MMATIGKSANIPIVGTPVMIAAPGVEGEEECKDGVMKLSDMISKLDPSAKVFVPAPLMPATKHLLVNGDINTSSSSRRSSGRLSADPSNLFMSSWRDGRRHGIRLQSIRTCSCLCSTRRVDQFLITNEERISRTVHVVDIDQSITEEQIVAVFSRCGQVTHRQVRGFFESFCGQVARSRLLGHHSHSTSIAFIEFTEAQNAHKALNCSGMFLGAFTIRVNASKTPLR